MCEKEFNQHNSLSQHAARRTELRRKAKGAARTRDRQAAAPQDEAEENDACDRGGSDKGENDESGTAAMWHEGCSEKRRETAKRDTKKQTPQGRRRLAHHTPLLLEVLEVDILWPRWVARIGVTRATEACFLAADRQCTELPLLSLKSLCGDGVPFSHPSLGLSVCFLSFFFQSISLGQGQGDDDCFFILPKS